MTAEQFVKSKMPDARAERHKQNGPYGPVYWCIKNGQQTMYFASGKTKSNAWVNAKKKLE